MLKINNLNMILSPIVWFFFILGPSMLILSCVHIKLSIIQLLTSLR